MQIDLHNVLNATNKGITSNFCLNVYNKSLAGAHTIVTAGGGRGAKWHGEKQNFYNVALLFSVWDMWNKFLTQTSKLTSY